MKKNKSISIYQNLCTVIPGGVNSPVRAFFDVKEPPLVAESASEDLLVDADGNSYIDYCGSWGALIHGHAHPEIIDSAFAKAKKGTTFGVTTEIEQQIAKQIIDLVDSVEKIRFVSSGTEATMSAVRLARGFTGKDLVIKFSGNYHGHADAFLVKAGSGVFTLNEASSAGIPKQAVQNTLCLSYNDSESFLKALQQPYVKENLAAVIIEPVAGNMGVVPATREFMEAVVCGTKAAKALLIFDEVITGFRVGLSGAQGLYGVTPDLTCFGKIIGGGFPAAAFGGRKDIMDLLAPIGGIYQAGTLSGNPVAMQAGLVALQMLLNPGFYEELERKTRIITDSVGAFIKEKKQPVSLQRVGSMFTLFFGKTSVSNMEEAKELNSSLFSKYFKHLFERGVYIPPSQYEACFVSMAHKEKHLEKTRDLILEFLEGFELS